MRLTAALIVRDEERFLAACLGSLAGLADDIVVVDTGSVDRSVEIAREHGARVIERPWTGDFAAARNASLDAAGGDWILYIDADERVVGFDRDEISALLTDRTLAGCTVLYRPGAGFTQYRELRLFRNRPEVRFRGVIHETMVPDLDALVARESAKIGQSSLAIDHAGYDGDLSRKHRRNLPLLLARLEREPHHVYCLDHLGRTLLGLGRAGEAEQAFRAAIDRSRAHPSGDAADSQAYLDLAALLLDTGRDATAVLDEAAARFPGHHAINWLRARAMIGAGRYEDALSLLSAIARVDPSGCVDSRVAYDTSIFGAAPHAAMGLCELKRGRLRESRAHFVRAEELAPGDLEIRTKRRWVEIQLTGAAGA